MMRLKPWLELVRVPNIFTAIADVLAGYWLVSDRLVFSWRLAELCLASACLYAFGIVLNDITDLKTDRQERPNRPLPSGRVSITAAMRLTVVLAVVALALAALAGFDTTVESPGFVVQGYDWRPIVAVVGLLIAIASYDLTTKGTYLGPLNMGICRGLNLVLGMCAGWWFTNDIGMLVVIAMVLYVASFTYFGVKEVDRSPRFRLATGAVGTYIAILLLVFLVAGRSLTSERYAPDWYLLVLWFALLIHVGRMSLRAIRRPEPQNVQNAMKTFILGIIAFDAIIAWSAQSWPSFGIFFALLVLTTICGLWIYST